MKHIAIALSLLVALVGPAFAVPVDATGSSFVEMSRAAILDHLLSQVGTPGAEFFVGTVRVENPYPAGPVTQIARVVTDGSPRSGRGVLMSLYVKGPGGEMREARAAVDLSVRVPVVVSTKAIASGTFLSADDLSVRLVESGADGGVFVNSVDDIVGKKSRWPLSTGVSIRREYIEDPEALKRGDAVTLVADSGAIRITSKGTALRGGKLGEMVTVRSVASGREATGRLMPGRVVVVD